MCGQTDCGVAKLHGWADSFATGAIPVFDETQERFVDGKAGKTRCAFRDRRLTRYFRWLAAPMKNSIGIESMKLIREA